MTFGLGFLSVIGRTWVLVRFVIVGFVFFPIASLGELGVFPSR